MSPHGHGLDPPGSGSSLRILSTGREFGQSVPSLLPWTMIETLKDLDYSPSLQLERRRAFQALSRIGTKPT